MTTRTRIVLGAAFLALGSLAAPHAARAELCTIDAVPAATLLVPYFDVDLEQCEGDGLRTFFTVNNANAAPTIAHVVLWTDWSIPTIAFDLFLTGFDVQTVDLKELFCRGTIPGFDGNGSPNTSLGGTTLAHLQAWFTGQQSPLAGNCAGAPRGNQVAVGYATIDNVQAANLGFPSAGASYFTNVSFENVLWGTLYRETFSTTTFEVPAPGACPDCSAIKKRKRKKRRKCDKQRLACLETVPTTTMTVTASDGLSGAPLVAIEAADGTFGAGAHTFYGRYLNGSGIDGREPLPSTLGVEYAQVADPNDYALIVWRDGNATATAVPCGSQPSWFPLGSGTQQIAFDEQENPVEIARRLDHETQLDPFLQSVPFAAGWLFLNLNHNKLAGVFSPEATAQAWVVRVRDGRLDASGVYQFDSGCN